VQRVGVAEGGHLRRKFLEGDLKKGAAESARTPGKGENGNPPAV